MRLASLRSCVIVACALLSPRVQAVAPPPSWGEPLQGAVGSGTVLTVIPADKGWELHPWRVPLGKDGPVHEMRSCGFSPDLPLRWSVGHGCVLVRNVWDGYGQKGG